MLLLSKKEDEAYQVFLDDLKKAHPDVAPQLDALAATEAGREIYRGGLRTADYYRKLNEFRDQKDEFERQKQSFEADVTKQYGWWNEAKPAYERAVAEKAALEQKLAAYASQLKEYGVETKDVIPQTPPQGSDNITQRELAELRARVQAMDVNFPGVMVGLLKAQQTAIMEGLPFDPVELFKKAAIDHKDPLVAFNEIVQPMREEKAKQLLKQELDKAKEEGRREALSKLSGPDKLVRPSAPSVVDALRSAEPLPLTNRAERLDAAVKDFMEMELSGQA